MIRLPVYDEFIEALATSFELVNGWPNSATVTAVGDRT